MILVLPGNLGLWDVYPVVQLDALPGVWIVVLGICTLVTATRLRRAASSSGPRRTAQRTVFVLLLSILLIEVTVFVRAGGVLPADLATVPSGRADLTVLSFNARGTDASSIVGAAVEAEADAVMLVETNGAVAAEIVDRLRRHGQRSQLFTASGTALDSEDEVAIIVDDRLGAYYEVPGPALAYGSLTIVPGDRAGSAAQATATGGPALSAVHPPAPVPGDVPSTTWGQQLQEAVDACSRESAIVGGDFNATSAQISHVIGDGCLDAGSHLGRGAVGTWPTAVPAPLGASIDHQLADENHWEPVGIRVLDIGRSDHRGIAVSYRAVRP
ncbi:endonuclease/exonuclease/phosphatase family protein [Kocuria sabuli]|uniref:endonuclease/exonuclease/phosphatase family protein n=1 Tax=Kocuria sabuli TaxID=3071448 RepID=UPI0034D7A8B1